MEPPAVTSCSVGSGRMHTSNGIDKSRREMLLRIDPQISYSSPSRDFEELPENFLETVSPQQSSQPTSEQSTPLSELPRTQLSSELSTNSDHRFLNGNSDLFSSLSNSRDSCGGLLIRSNASDVLGDNRRPLSYIKEESPNSLSYHSNDCEPVYLPSSYGQELDHLEDHHHHAHRHSPDSLNSEIPSSVMVISNEERLSPSQFQQKLGHQKSPNNEPVPQVVYSTSDMTDPLNAEIDDDIYIDTRDLCKRVAYELKQHSIPQAIFAERILCRSQGTLSDLLRNPKPWNRLKSGRETFRRMYNWIQQPIHTRLAILDMFKGVAPTGSGTTSPTFAPTPAQNKGSRSRSSASSDDQPQKRPRLVFTDIQKRTLQAIFKETQRPSREMQQTIAEHLRLDMSTVSNFFMNARRRSRNGNNFGDEPAPYQQVRQITPPPEEKAGGLNSAQRYNSMCYDPQHIDEAVAAVASGFSNYPEEQNVPSDDHDSDVRTSESLDNSADNEEDLESDKSAPWESTHFTIKAEQDGSPPETRSPELVH